MEDIDDTRATEFNDEKASADMVALQKRLELLRGSLLTAKATLAATNKDEVDPEDDLYGRQDKVDQLTMERTQTFLNFSNLRTALQLAQTNRVLTEALGLEKDGNIQLETEEVEYVRQLLDEKRELVNDLMGQQKEGIDKEIELISVRGQLAGLITDMKRLMGELKEVRGGTKTWDKKTHDIQESVEQGDYKLNQMRFTIQKFILSFPNRFKMFDDTSNKEVQEMFLRCGKTPEEMREEFFAEGQEMASAETPAAN